MNPSIPSVSSNISDIVQQEMLSNFHRTQPHIWNALQSRQLSKIQVCSKNHPLEIVLDSTYSQTLTMWVVAECDKCRRTIKGACWRCNICRYDACYDCLTFPRTLCYRRHLLKPVTQDRLINLAPTCNICLRKIYLACYAVCCQLCEYDICGNCWSTPVTVGSGSASSLSTKK